MTHDLEHRLDALSAPRGAAPPPPAFLERVGASRRRSRRRGAGALAGVVLVAGAGVAVWRASQPGQGPVLGPQGVELAGDGTTTSPMVGELPYSLASAAQSLAHPERLQTSVPGLSSGDRVLRMIDGADPDVLDRMLREW